MKGLFYRDRSTIVNGDDSGHLTAIDWHRCSLVAGTVTAPLLLNICQAFAKDLTSLTPFRENEADARLI